LSWAPRASIMKTAANSRPASPRARRVLLILAALVIVVGTAALWRFGPLGAFLDAHRLAALGSALRARPDAPVLVLAVYLLAALVLFPMTPLLAATALVFDPWRGLAFGLAGALAAAALTYGLGRFVGRHRARWVEGARFARVRERLRRRGVLATAGVRLVPVGNFSLANLAAGALNIPFPAFMLGNVLGLLPGLLALTLLGDHLRGLGWGAP
jgi:phospholipase D1/2